MTFCPVSRSETEGLSQPQPAGGGSAGRHSGSAASGRAMRAPTVGTGVYLGVGADAHIGPRRKAASYGGCGGLIWPFVPPHLRRRRRGGLDGRPEPPASCDSLPETHPGHGRPYRPPLQNPSGMASPCHIPSSPAGVRGGFGCCARRWRSNHAAQRTRDARPYGEDG